MKKIVSVCLMCLFVASAAMAMPGGTIPYGITAKYAAMGGAGSALVDDVAAAYYNPAGMAEAQAIALKIGLGTASEGMNDLMQTLGSASDPSKFILDNYANAINVNGSANLFVGLHLLKTGISVISTPMVSISKLANTANGNASALLNGEGAVTLGYGVGLPYLGSANIGANIKYILQGSGTAVVAGATSSTTTMTYTGMGYDIGLQTKVGAIPMIPSLDVALVLKDLGETLNGNMSTTSKTINPATGAVISETKSPDTPIAGVTSPTTLVIGAATKIPGIGLKVAADLDNVSGGTAGVSYSVTHLGVEYPVMMGVVNLRAGLISGGPGGNISMTTYGAGILGDMINVAMVSDGKNSKNNQMMADVHIGF